MVVANFERVKEAVDFEQVNAVIDRSEQHEQMELERKRTVRRKHYQKAR